MLRHLRQMLAASIALLAAAAMPAQGAVVLLQDNFDSDGAASVLNFNGFANWNVDNGTVDYIRSGGFGIGCAGGAGGCVDLDGSSNNGGRMLSKLTFNLVASETYRFTLDVSGNQRGGAADTLTFGFLGQASLTPAAIPPGAPFTVQSFEISGFSGPTQFFIETASNDNIGPIIDNVLVQCVSCQPNNVAEPGMLALFSLGLMGLGLRRRRA